ncbi:hypothetical protein BSLG_002333 [Batrachochytrium salamandrivorans]|nr:hypothetical protein BASA62_005561 [Batrachochytrium salamandrivorans]KAJ1343307.1 hypothetical protein BSLG_002333 [Batrachochytrium salamandrivorans]
MTTRYAASLLLLANVSPSLLPTPPPSHTDGVVKSKSIYAGWKPPSPLPTAATHKVYVERNWLLGLSRDQLNSIIDSNRSRFITH